ncbi:MAG: hypothetical protein Q7S40_15145 [Opitutaceae bacterium]|nr:hypothetical protein [Opitutaceae bacterium]
MKPSVRSRSLMLVRAALAFGIATVVPVTLLAQKKPDKSERRDSKRESDTVSNGKPNIEEKGLARLREHFAITDDAEWELIAARIRKIIELRGSLPKGSPATLAAPSFGKPGGRGGSPEQDSLRTALKDNLPDAEIKLRLVHQHQIYRQNEERLVKAQDELRAVLTVRQEAVAVLAGLLPP